MKRGDSIMIYEDCITKKRPEGKARLVKALAVPQLDYWEGKQIEVHRWQVIFESDNFLTERQFTTLV